MANAIWENDKGTYLRVIVHPNSKERKFVAEVTQEAININLRSPAREGKANSELIKKLAKILRLSTGNIILIAGHKSREKTLLIVGIDAEHLTKKISSET